MEKYFKSSDKCQELLRPFFLYTQNCYVQLEVQIGCSKPNRLATYVRCTSCLTLSDMSMYFSKNAVKNIQLRTLRAISNPLYDFITIVRAAFAPKGIDLKGFKNYLPILYVCSKLVENRSIIFFLHRSIRADILWLNNYQSN